MIAFTAWQPDLDPALPGILVDVSGAIPSERGYAGMPSTSEAIAGMADLATTARGLGTVRNTSGTRRLLAGTQTKLYEVSGVTWSDISRAGNYTGSTDSRWTFDQFGDVALASNGVEKIQASASGAFADVTAAPVAQAMFTTPNFVFALGYDSTKDGWRCSAFQDHTSWATSTATQATSGRLIGNGGALTAGLRLNDYAVAYKDTSIFLGQYVGPPIVWQWNQIAGVGGCVGVDAVCDIGRAHVFVGPDDIWLFDGATVRSIADGVRQTIFAEANGSYLFRTIVRHDSVRGLVWIFYPAGSSQTCDSAVVWHIRSGRWGKASLAVNAAGMIVPPGLTYATWDSAGATYDSLPSAPYDSPLWSGGGDGSFGIISDVELLTLNGSSAGGSLTTGDFGDDTGHSMLRRSYLHTSIAPTSATAQAFYRASSGAALSGGAVSTGNESKFDHRQTGRWHRVVYTLTGDFDARGITPDLVRAGSR